MSKLFNKSSRIGATPLEAVEPKRVAVIGGGISGLAAAKSFLQRGHDVVGYERYDDFGGVWHPSRSYIGITTNTPKDLYRYSDLPMPSNYDEWPEGEQVQAYLKLYADKHGLVDLFELGTSVTSMQRRPDGKSGWRLTLEKDQSKSESPTSSSRMVEDFDFVAVCTGVMADKYEPRFLGEDSFKDAGGAIIHSSHYRDTKLIDGKSVVVLGGSKSATDVAVHAAKHGAKSVTLVYRRNVWRIPKYLGGVNVKYLLFQRAQEVQFRGYAPSTLKKAVSTIFRPAIWANFRGLEKALAVQLGLGTFGMVPETRIDDEASCTLPLVTDGMYEMFRDGSIKPVKGTFDKYGKKSVVLSTGEVVDCDVAILATGWEMKLPFLHDDVKARLIESDGQYRLYRYAVNPDLTDMGFVGLNNSFCSVLTSEVIAEWLVRYADGKLVRQPTIEEMTSYIDDHLEWRRNVYPAAKSYGGNCVAPFHYQHFEELFQDMGAKKFRTGNLFKDHFYHPDADLNGQFLATAPQYKASHEVQ